MSSIGLKFNQDPLRGFTLGHKHQDNKEPPKEDSKPDYSYAGAKIAGKHSHFVVLVLMLTVFVMVAGVLWALYVFFHNSKIINMAGVRVTSNLKAFIFGEEEKSVLREPPAGYENWTYFRNNSYEILSPPGWELKEGEELTIRKYNLKVTNQFDSLSAIFKIKRLDNPANLPIEAVVSESLPTGVELIKKQIGGQSALWTKEIYDDENFKTEKTFWPCGASIFEVKAVYYNAGFYEEQKIFEKFTGSLKCL